MIIPRSNDEIKTIADRYFAKTCLKPFQHFDDDHSFNAATEGLLAEHEDLKREPIPIQG